MKTLALATSLFILLALFTGCQGGKDSDSPDTGKAAVEAPRGAQGGSASSEERPAYIEGAVISTQDAGGYTYVELDAGSKTVWAAGPRTPVKVGDRLKIDTSMLMPNFRSESLGRSFDEIYFTNAFGDVQASGGSQSGGSVTPTEASEPQASLMPKGHPSVSGATEALALSGLDLGEIAKAESGYTIAELWGKKDELGGKEIAVRGKVVKFLGGIMDRNWLHIVDGTGEGESATITVTTDQSAEAGDLVLVRGQFAKDVDFGSGYHYDVIIEKASITVE